MDNSILPRNRDYDLRDLERKADWVRLETLRLVEWPPAWLRLG